MFMQQHLRMQASIDTIERCGPPRPGGLSRSARETNATGGAMSYSWGAGPASVRTEVLPVVPPQAAVRPPSGAVGTDLRRPAAELAPMADVWRRLLHQHVPDGVGRCRTCTKCGTGVPHVSWPCSLHGVAELARRCHAGEAR
jgi:hypothetical protein